MVPILYIIVWYITVQQYSIVQCSAYSHRPPTRDPASTHQPLSLPLPLRRSSSPSSPAAVWWWYVPCYHTLPQASLAGRQDCGQVCLSCGSPQSSGSALTWSVAALPGMKAWVGQPCLISPPVAGGGLARGSTHDGCRSPRKQSH